MTKVIMDSSKEFVWDASKPGRFGEVLRNGTVRQDRTPGCFYVVWYDKEAFGIGVDSDNMVIEVELCEIEYV